jgi:alkylation response protein AidB-like acyl-CoA dehydrogenase
MFTLTEEQQMLKDAAKSFMQEQSPVGRLRKVRDANLDGFDKDLWKEIVDLGWTGILVPEEFGGSALGYLGLGVVLEEAGRTLSPSPLLSTALIGASALLLGGNAAQKGEWLPKIVDGSAIVALAVDEGPHHTPAKTALKAEKAGAGYKLTGKKMYVADGHVANLLIVPARTSGKAGDSKGITIFLVPADAKGVKRTTLKTMDSRGAADIEFDGVEVPASAVLGSVDAGGELLDQILDRARIGLSAEMLGSASQAFEMINAYLKTRVQFGQLIGSFQALQHRAAKMFTELELTRSCVIGALDALDENRNDIAEMASLAKARAGDTLHLISNECIQMHGGIGMTDAHDAGFYLKRARVAEGLYGNQAFHRDRYATINGY